MLGDVHVKSFIMTFMPLALAEPLITVFSPSPAKVMVPVAPSFSLILLGSV